MGRLCRSSSFITLPRLQPIFITAIMLSAILTSASIQFVYILTNGGPADRTQIFPTMAYNLALEAPSA